MRGVSFFIVLLAACGGTPARSNTGAEADPVSRGPLEVLSDPTRLEDDVSRSIEQALTDQIGFPARVVARAGAGDEHLVLYAMNGATHWLAHHPQREELVRAIQECEEEPDDTRNCTDVVLRDVRDTMLLERLADPCMDDEVASREECMEIASSQLVFDVEAYCETGFWSLARRSGSGWTLEPRGRLPEECLTRVVGLEAADLDGDGEEELLLDAMYDSMDYLRLVNELRLRTLTVWRSGAPVLSRVNSIRLGTYAVDMGPLDELRCHYDLTDTAPPSLSLECCEEPVDEEEDASEEPPSYATWPPSSECGPHWTETYPSHPRSGFRVCHRVASRDETPLRSEPDASAEETDQLRDGSIVHVIGERGEWIEVIVRGGRGWMPISATRDECADAP